MKLTVINKWYYILIAAQHFDEIYFRFTPDGVEVNDIFLTSMGLLLDRLVLDLTDIDIRGLGYSDIVNLAEEKINDEVNGHQ